MQVTVDQKLRPENRTRQEKQESIYILTLPGGGPKQSFGPRGRGTMISYMKLFYRKQKTCLF